ncbi:MAG: sulfotransferase domain-containing protein [Candidatus Eremiobacteraeota bacterium]|nr:sulfotransferase domain-containing protein [Candidatus Eremiobacteraeota bacterium]
MRRLVWLASYPKSGNTWFRAFLRAFLSGSVDVNQLGFDHSGRRRDLDEMLAIETAYLLDHELERLRPDVYRARAAECEQPALFVKTHEGFRRLEDGRALFVPECTRGVVYLVRNPLDVVVSYAFHLEQGDFDQAIAKLAVGQTWGWVRDRYSHQIGQLVPDWSSHVVGWLDNAELPVHLVRYEALLETPEATFSQALDFLGLHHTPEQVARAVELSSFQRLRQQEQQQGFWEKMRLGVNFFRRGQAGDWRRHLSREQVERVVAQHQKVMARLGYLPKGG